MSYFEPSVTIALSVFGSVIVYSQYRISNLSRRLKVAENNFRRLIDTNIVGIVLWKLNGEIFDANDTFLNLVGLSREELKSGALTWDTIIPAEFSELESTAIETLRKERKSKIAEKEIVTKDGRRLYVLFAAAMLENHSSDAVAYIVDRSEKKRAEELLQLHSEELERSNDDLESFAYVASHDLQEPLRMIASYTQLLSDRYTAKIDQDGKDFMNFVVDGARRMQALINDLLIYSRLRRPNEKTETHELSLIKVIELACHNLKFAIEDSGAQIETNDLPIVKGSQQMLVQLFQNLIGNAIKFKSERTPQISISAKSENNQWVIAVKDNGIGFAKEFSERIFVLFQRLHTSDQYPGTGIGLALSKKIVEFHGGKIMAEAVEGEGSCFVIRMPRLEGKPNAV